MTNEEILEHGGTDMLAMLWENNRGFIAQMAARWPRLDGVEFDDIFQSGFLAVAEAAERFDPAKGSFLTCLSFCLKKYFSLCNAAASGWTRGQYERGAAPADSLNRIVYADEGDGVELIELIAGTDNPYNEVEERLYRAELRRVLNVLIDKLPPLEAAVIRLRFFQGLSYEDIAKKLSVPVSACRRAATHAITVLSGGVNRARLKFFLDNVTNFYRHSGVRSFNTTFTSDVEKICMHRERVNG